MTLDAIGQALRERALRYPETYEEAPWGDRVIKVAGKIFMFWSARADQLGMTVRLPLSGFTVLANPFAAPTGYGLARSGWVSLTFTRVKDVPQADLYRWLDESYRTVAPKRLVKTLPADGPPPAAKKPGKLPPVVARLALASEDDLRGERAAVGFRTAGIETTLYGVPRPELVEDLVSTPPDALMVDLGRRPAAGIELVRTVLGEVPDLPIVFAGVRDAKTERSLADEMPDVVRSRLPPGDPKLVEAVVSRLRVYDG